MTMPPSLPTTFQDVRDAEVGKVFIDKFDEGLRFLVLRGPVAVCAYVGIPESHPLADFSYEALPIRAHGGLTYATKGDGKYFPTGFFWYGWDYAHAGDVSTYDTQHRDGETAWTPEEVEKDSWGTLWDFHKLMNLAEGIANKATRGDA